ncbi:MAG: glutathione S-transferase family protein [Gammaproteobacteria bacterium]
MPTLYGTDFSGNCYKIQLLFAQLGLAYRWEPVDILAGASRTVDFLALNPNGRVPVLLLDDGRTLAESNAILNYLADGHPLLPSERFERACVLSWQFFEQYSHEPYIATSRFIRAYLGNPPDRAGELAQREAPGYAALDVMERHLGANDFFAAGRYTIADISLYAYTHVADEGGFSLDDYPAVRAWLGRVAGQPGHVPMRRGDD